MQGDGAVSSGPLRIGLPRPLVGARRRGDHQLVREHHGVGEHRGAVPHPIDGVDLLGNELQDGCNSCLRECALRRSIRTVGWIGDLARRSSFRNYPRPAG